MHPRTAARFWHGATLVIGVFALVVQVILVVIGESVLVEEESPTLGERIVRLVGYFTIQANVLVVATALTLVRNPARDGRAWRVIRLAAVVGITVTMIIHWFFLRPLLDLASWSYLCDKMLHVVVPVLAILGWLCFGPRPRVTITVVLLGLIWPAAWLAYTLIRGVATGWYPYPFLDIGAHGGARVAVASFAITGLVVVVSLLVWLVDRRLPVRFRR